MTAEGLLPIDFISQSTHQVIIDVRSPIEYNRGHILNAINIPLFEDNERAEIGTLYKMHGKQTAVARGYELVEPKLTEWVNQVKQLANNKSVFVYCFRGGMRSTSFTWLLNQNNIAAKLLTGGYKNYRQLVLSTFEKPYQLVMLGGATGSRKTDLLRYMHTTNLIPSVDLEGLAHHKGSVFGGIGEEAQLPQPLFENHLFNVLQHLNTSFLVEDEAMSIGYNKVPYHFWLQMKQAPIIKLEIPFELRLKKIMEDYSKASIHDLKICISKISEQLGGERTKICLNLLRENEIEAVARITLSHYDKQYAFKYNKNVTTKIYAVASETDDISYNANLIAQTFKQLCPTLN